MAANACREDRWAQDWPVLHLVGSHRITAVLELFHEAKKKSEGACSSRQKSTQNWQISALHSHVQLPLACFWQQQSSVAPTQLSPKSSGGSQSVEGPVWPWSETSQEAVSGCV